MIPTQVLKEAENLEIHARMWKAYYFYVMFDLHKFFLREKLENSHFHFPKPSQLLNDTLLLVVNYYDDIDNRLQKDAFKNAIQAFDDQHDIATFLPLMGLKSFNEESYFQKVIQPHINDNELIDQFLIHDSKVNQFSKKKMKKLLKDLHENPSDYFAW